MVEWWTQPMSAQLELRRLGDGSLELISGDGRSPVGTITCPIAKPWRLTAGDLVWSFAPYDRGFRFAIVGERDSQPHVWYEGGSGIHGGRILFGGSGMRGGRLLLGPDRAYRLRSWLPLAKRWRVLDRRKPIVRLRAASRRTDVELLVDPLAIPSVASDAPLLIMLACAVALQQLAAPSVMPSPSGAG